MKNAELGLGILGLTRVERMTVASVCALTRSHSGSRARGYTVLPEERGTEADILLVDADDAYAYMLWEASPMRRNGCPALMISRDPTRVDIQPHALARTSFASRLVKALDQMMLHDVRHRPEAFVDDTPTDNDGLGIAMRTAEPPPANVPRVLVIDDSVVLRTKMRTLLELHRLNADLASTAEQGLELMRLHRYALVFIDAQLSEVDGYTLCRRIRSLDRASTPIVMLTNRHSAFDKLRAKMAGCSRYLTKPLPIGVVRELLNEFVPEHVSIAPAHGTQALRPTG